MNNFHSLQRPKDKNLIGYFHSKNQNNESSCLGTKDKAIQLPLLSINLLKQIDFCALPTKHFRYLVHSQDVNI